MMDETTLACSPLAPVPSGTPAQGPMPEFAETVLPFAAAAAARGERLALATIVGIDGTGPRPLGAQMAVTADGAAIGFLSGGCLEGAIVAEAQALIQARRNRTVRYGKGSPYLDIRLPCGSGLDIHFDQGLPPALIVDAAARNARREPFTLVSDLESGAARLEPAISHPPVCRRLGSQFQRPYLPSLRLAVIGTGPASVALAGLAHTAGLDVVVVSPEAAVRARGERLGLATVALDRPEMPPALETDAWTAAAILFHEHAWEGALLAPLLASPCFYVGAQGSLRVHEERLAVLAAAGVPRETLARLKSPIGLIPSAKSPLEIAVGVLAEVMAEARRNKLVL